MRIIDRLRDTFNDSEYIISTGWGHDCDIRFEIHDEAGNCWDIFLDREEIEYMHDFMGLFLRNEKLRQENNNANNNPQISK